MDEFWDLFVYEEVVDFFGYFLFYFYFIGCDGFLLEKLGYEIIFDIKVKVFGFIFYVFFEILII